MSDPVAEAFITTSRDAMRASFEKISHCINQLSESDLTWRPFEQANSVTNIILHLCGNLRQWVIHGAGEAPDVRNRPGEFSDRSIIAGPELIGRLCQTIHECDATIARLSADDLTQPRTIQGFQTNKLAAIFDSVAHLQGHTQEIIYITRLRLGDRYKFKWVPKGKEQGG
jgi:hypothetical protein